MNKTRVALLALAVGVVLVLFVGIKDRRPTIVRMEASYTAEFEKPEVLAREVDNLFIGLVKAVSGTHYVGGSSIPSTLYKVEVLEAWKGNARGTILINQDSGLDMKRNTVYLTNGDELLEVNKIYLFATNNQGKWQTLIPVFGDVPVNDEEGRSHLWEKFRGVLPQANQRANM